MQTFYSFKNRQAKRTVAQELLITSALTAVGTAALVGIHHRYRKQHQPDASIQDYVIGICSQLALLSSTSKQHLRCLGTDSNNRAVSTAPITTMLPRPVCWVSGVASMPKHTALVKQAASHANDFGVVGIDADRQIVWQTTMPERVHDIVVQPATNAKEALFDDDNNHNVSNRHNDIVQYRDVAVMGRRPSETFWVLDTATGQVKTTVNAVLNRHFYGHACYSLDGKWLYMTENDTISLDGKIGIYDACNDYKKIAEFDSYGIGPHELIMHPDGKTLIIANGGIKTEQASREELNLDTMRPSLVYLDRHNGALLEQITPEHNQMSVRHLDIHDDGTVMIGIQFQGERHINVPLVLTHKRGETELHPLIMPHNQWQPFHQYIASVAVDSTRNQLCVTTPVGGCVAIFDLPTRKLIEVVSLPDCAGAAVVTDRRGRHCAQSGFIVSDGQGQLTILSIKDLSETAASLGNTERVQVDSQLHRMSFDNHLQALFVV